jgi:hypothetical protein
MARYEGRLGLLAAEDMSAVMWQEKDHFPVIVYFFLHHHMARVITQKNFASQGQFSLFSLLNFLDNFMLVCKFAAIVNDDGTFGSLLPTQGWGLPRSTYVAS